MTNIEATESPVSVTDHAAPAAPAEPKTVKPIKAKTEKVAPKKAEKAEKAAKAEKPAKGKAEKSAKAAPPKADVPPGARLVAMDPNDVVIGGYDEPVAAVDPLFDERASKTDEQLDIDGLAESILAANSDVVISGTMRGKRVFVKLGRRRTRASRKAWAKAKKSGQNPPGFYVIVSVEQSADQTAMEVLAENHNRVNDDVVTAARKIERLIESRGWEVATVASLMGTTTQTVRNMRSLLKLDESVQEAIITRQIGASVGYTLAKLSSEAQIEALAKLRESAEKSGGKVRFIDATVAVNNETDAVDAEFELDDDGNEGGGKGKGKTKKAKAATGPKYEAPTNAQIRRFVNAVNDKTIVWNFKDKNGWVETEEGKIRDEDFRSVLEAVREDPWSVFLVFAGGRSAKSIPGLVKCLQYIGVELRS